MQQRPEIFLAPGTEFVETGAIPALIAAALHPDAEDEPRTIAYLTKTARPGAKGETAKWRGWPIDDGDRAILDRIWTELPKLVLPIIKEAWQPYADAFQQRGKHLDWDVGVVLNNPSLEASILRNVAEQDHRTQSRNAIGRGELKQLSPASNIATTIYLENGKVAVDALTQYVAQFHIGVQLALRDGKQSTRPLPQLLFQEQEILRVIGELGYKPQALPKYQPGHGKIWVRAAVRERLNFTPPVFNKAWQRLRDQGEIQEAT